MPRCINNCYDLESFWKSWHASFNKWLVRYMYIPLGGSGRKLLNVWVIFTYVAIWHDLEWKLLSWAWLTCIFLIPKIVIKSSVNAFQVAGTEDGIKEPWATFLACFGAAFIMLHSTRYAAMLAEKMQKYGAIGLLVNTGWYGGRYCVGSCIKLPYTRKIIDSIHSGSLLTVDCTKIEVFGLEIPTEVEGL